MNQLWFGTVGRIQVIGWKIGAVEGCKEMYYGKECIYIN